MSAAIKIEPAMSHDSIKQSILHAFRDNRTDAFFRKIPTDSLLDSYCEVAHEIYHSLKNPTEKESFFSFLLASNLGMKKA